jgi:hypothetical protein
MTAIRGVIDSVSTRTFLDNVVQGLKLSNCRPSAAGTNHPASSMDSLSVSTNTRDLPGRSCREVCVYDLIG